MQQNYKQQVIDFFNSRTAYNSEGDSHPREAKRLLEYVTILFNIDLPHIIRPLWTSEACCTMLRKSGFQKIEIEKHQYCKYRIDKNYASTRIEQEFYPRVNPLLNLSEAQIELLQVEYKKAIEHLIAKQGVWQEAVNLYVKARK